MGLGLAFRSFFAALGNGYEAKRIAEALAPVEWTVTRRAAARR